MTKAEVTARMPLKNETVRINDMSRPTLACLASALLLLVGCASAPPKTAAPAAPESVPEYRIGAGDMLAVQVFGHVELNASVPVRPDGLITTPLVEDMQAAGKTSTELARDIEKALSEYVRTPKVTVVLSAFQGNLGDQIRVVGQAASPQSLPYRSGMTLLDVMIAVRGLGPFAAGNRAKVVRRTATGPTEIKVRLNDLIDKGDMRANLQMQPGDVVIIPQTRF